MTAEQLESEHTNSCLQIVSQYREIYWSQNEENEKGGQE